MKKFIVFAMLVAGVTTTFAQDATTSKKSTMKKETKTDDGMTKTDKVEKKTHKKTHKMDKMSDKTVEKTETKK